MKKKKMSSSNRMLYFISVHKSFSFLSCVFTTPFFALLCWGLWLSRQSVIDIIKSVLISFVSCDNVVNGREQVRSCGKIIYTTKGELREGKKEGNTLGE